MITSRQNERLKDIRRLRQCKDKRPLDRAVRGVLEGPHLVSEALDAGLPLESLLVTPQFADSDLGQHLLPRLPHRPIEVDPNLMDDLTDSDSPRGLLAVVTLPAPPLDDWTPEPDAVYVFAEGLQDPGNLGALARSAEASGVRGLFLDPGCAHRQHPRALRGSAGSLLRLPTFRTPFASFQERLTVLHAAPRFLALVPEGGTSLYTEDLKQGALVLLLGSEGRGLSSGVARQADGLLTIPMAEPVESLNATVAASLVLFEVRRQRLGS